MASYDAHVEGKELDIEESSGLHTANGKTKEQSSSSPRTISPSGQDDAELGEPGDEVVRTVTGFKVCISRLLRNQMNP